MRTRTSRSTASTRDGLPAGQEDEPPPLASSPHIEQAFTSSDDGEPTPAAEDSDQPPPARGAAAARQPRLRSFVRTFYPGVSRSQWNDWRWQLANRVTGPELGRFLVLSRREREAVSGGVPLPLAVTPYYLSLLDPLDPGQPLRRAVVPTSRELVRGPGESDDPLNEEGDSPVPGLVHRYPDRVLLLATGHCAVYCRYCTRSRMVGGHGRVSTPDWERMIAYIQAHREVRDVLLSGGDPLTLDDRTLAHLLGRLRRIPHVEILRIGTKVPVVLPQRITPQLVRTLRAFHPLFMSVHVTHPDELTPETTAAFGRLADAGIPLGSQTVLLRGINDRADVLKRLFHGLLRARVRPYYLYQCDPISGSAHFRTSVAWGLELMAGLRGHTSGYAVPTYVIDAPGGGGKVAVYPPSIICREGGDLLLRNYRGRCYRYPDTAPREEAGS
ncbi:MAG: KamA family radical SAM protein [Spirochaetota bacterium]